MRYTPKRAADVHRDRWMVSYMDVLTILLIFFLVAAARSVAMPPAPAPPAPVAATRPSTLLQKLTALNIDVKQESRGLVISLPQTILFASGDDAIGAQARPVIGEIAGILRDVPNNVTLVGHADAVPIHNKRFKNNWELAAARGLRLLELLGDEGIAEARLSVASYSSNDPRDTNSTEGGRASNRRVEIVILDE
jgi:chemotaxis protein MotB